MSKRIEVDAEVLLAVIAEEIAEQFAYTDCEGHGKYQGPWIAQNVVERLSNPLIDPRSTGKRDHGSGEPEPDETAKEGSAGMAGSRS